MLDKGLMEDGKKCITKREADKATVVPVEESKWDLPRVGIKPMCPALVGRFFTTEPPGKPYFG